MARDIGAIKPRPLLAHLRPLHSSEHNIGMRRRLASPWIDAWTSHPERQPAHWPPSWALSSQAMLPSILSMAPARIPACPAWPLQGAGAEGVVLLGSFLRAAPCTQPRPAELPTPLSSSPHRASRQHAWIWQTHCRIQSRTGRQSTGRSRRSLNHEGHL